MKKLHITEAGKRVLALGLALVSLGSSGIAKKEVKDEVSPYIVSQANPQMKDLTIYQGVNIFINDHTFVPKDVLGREVKPFVYNGTTYLPIRAIANALGAEVGYANGVATITKKQDGKLDAGVEYREDTPLSMTTQKATTNVRIEINGKPFIPKDISGKPVDIYAINGTTYIPVRALCDELGIAVTWDGLNNRVYLGNHISLVDPNMTNDKQRQNCCNLSLISFEQYKQEVQTLKQQLPKLKEIHNELMSKLYFMDSKTLRYSELYNLQYDAKINIQQTEALLSQYTDDYINAEYQRLSMAIQNGSTQEILSFYQLYLGRNQYLSRINDKFKDQAIVNINKQMQEIMNMEENSLSWNGKIANAIKQIDEIMPDLEGVSLRSNQISDYFNRCYILETDIEKMYHETPSNILLNYYLLSKIKTEESSQILISVNSLASDGYATVIREDLLELKPNSTAEQLEEQIGITIMALYINTAEYTYHNHKEVMQSTSEDEIQKKQVILDDIHKKVLAEYQRLHPAKKLSMVPNNLNYSF